MQVLQPNNVKIYNLSCGKSLPEWLSEKKKRQLIKNDTNIRRRIELIQDFGMPSVSNKVSATPDNNYILTTGVYKPRLRCFDVKQLSMKFERCMDSVVITFVSLSEDYSKIVFMQEDRYIEFHAQYGRYYRTRLPIFGRDMSYHDASCDLYCVGVSSEIHRLNLEQGHFMKPLSTEMENIFCCQFNSEHNLFVCGGNQGRIECFDPRVRNCVGSVIVGTQWIDDVNLKRPPSISSLRYSGALNLAVGTESGHILLYDIRSSKPFLVKSHRYDQPIRSICFHPNTQHILSIDRKIVKIWNKNDGKNFTTIEPGVTLNDLCVIGKSGLIFLANESPKIQSYFIPSLGPAPKWCAFLDRITEELEEEKTDLISSSGMGNENGAVLPNVFDDYKFVTRENLQTMGLENLIGTDLLRAYMHGYFIDEQLYRKAKSIVKPFNYEEYRSQKLRDILAKERASRIKLNETSLSDTKGKKSSKPLPKVNRDLAKKLRDECVNKNISKKKRLGAVSILSDSRFSSIFSDPNFEVDTESEEYRLLNPVVLSHTGDSNKKDARANDDDNDNIDDNDDVNQSVDSDADNEQFANQQSSDEEPLNENFDDENRDDDLTSSSSDDEHNWAEEVKQRHREIIQKKRAERQMSWVRAIDKAATSVTPDHQKPPLSKTPIRTTSSTDDATKITSSSSTDIIIGGDIKSDVSSFSMGHQFDTVPLSDRMKHSKPEGVLSQKHIGCGNIEMTFQTNKSTRRKDAMIAHRRERKKIRRSAHEILKESLVRNQDKRNLHHHHHH